MKQHVYLLCSILVSIPSLSFTAQEGNSTTTPFFDSHNQYIIPIMGICASAAYGLYKTACRSLRPAQPLAIQHINPVQNYGADNDVSESLIDIKENYSSPSTTSSEEDTSDSEWAPVLSFDKRLVQFKKAYPEKDLSSAFPYELSDPLYGLSLEDFKTTRNR